MSYDWGLGGVTWLGTENDEDSLGGRGLVCHGILPLTCLLKSGLHHIYILSDILQNRISLDRSSMAVSEDTFISGHKVQCSGAESTQQTSLEVLPMARCHMGIL